MGLSGTRGESGEKGSGRVIEGIHRSVFVPLPVAVAFRPARILEGEKSQVWVRLRIGDAETPELVAEVIDDKGQSVRRAKLEVPTSFSKRSRLPSARRRSWFSRCSRVLRTACATRRRTSSFLNGFVT